MQGNEPEVVMAIFPLLPVVLGAASAGISAYGKYKATKAGKPGGAFRRKANTGYLRKYMSDLQGRSADRARTELAMRPALRMIGAQQRQGQRQLAYQAAQQGLEGSGIEAQKQLALQQGTTQAVAGLGEKVLNQELARARQMQAAREGQRMKIAGEIGQKEGAVAEANRMAQFQAAEAMKQHEQRVSAAKGNIGTSMLGGAISAGMPYAEAAYKAKMLTPGIDPNVLTTAETAATQYDVAGNPVSVEQDESGWWAETDPYSSPTSDQIIAGVKKGGRVTKDGIAQYYNGGSVEDVRAAVPSIVTEEEKLKKQYQTEYDPKLAEYETKKTAFETAETERKKQIEEGTQTYEQTLISPEYQQLEEQSNILEKFNLGKKEYANAQKLFEQNQKYAEADTKKISSYPGGGGYTVPQSYDSLEDFIANSPEGKFHYGKDSKYRVSKRTKGKLIGKLEKEKQALLGEKPEEFVAGEFKMEAPTLQEATPKELQKMQTREIYKQLVGGIDVAANIGKAKKNREATDFFKQFSAGTMTTDQIWSHPWATDNPKQIATLISQGQTAQAKALKDRQAEFTKLETTQRNIRGHLVDIGGATAGGKSTIGAEGVAIADDKSTPDIDESMQDPGGNIARIMEENPYGVTSSDRDQLYLYVDELLKSQGGIGFDPDLMNKSKNIENTDAEGQDNLIMQLMGMQTGINKKSSITKLLKELLKIPVTAPTQTLAEEVEKVDSGFSFSAK